MQYGLGTYLSELTESLQAISDLFIFIVSYHNKENKELTLVKKSSRCTEIAIPTPSIQMNYNKTNDKKYAATVVGLLSKYIPLEADVIFQLNFIDDLPIASALKEHYNYPVISVVQFAQWQQLFEGNRQKIVGLNIDEPSNNNEFTFHQEKKMYQISDHIVSVTRYMKDFLVSEYKINPDIISVIPNGLNYSKFKLCSKKDKQLIRQNLGFNKDEIIILFSGRIDICKGVFFLLKAFENSCKQNANLRLVFMGQGDIGECFKKLQSFFGKVTFTGFLPKDLVMSFYQIADVGIVPSVYDHCPLTILEMMANKIPLIVSRVNGPDEMLDDNQCVFIDPIIDKSGEIKFNEKNISDAILHLAGDKSLRTRIANNAYKKLREVYSAKVMAEKMREIFSTFLFSNIS